MMAVGFVCLWVWAFGAWSWQWSDVTVRWQVCTFRIPVASSVAISPDGKRLVSGSDQGTLLKIWDTATGTEVSSHGECAVCSEESV